MLVEKSAALLVLQVVDPNRVLVLSKRTVPPGDRPAVLFAILPIAHVALLTGLPLVPATW